MNGQELIAALHAGEFVFGTLIVSPSPVWPRPVKSLGMDMVFIDTEHMPLDRATVSWMCRTYSALDLAPVVRIPSPDPYQAQMVLDGGAAGIIAPYVETPDQVRALGGAVKLGPLKGQKLQALLDGETQAEPQLSDYLAQRNSGKALFINIESVPALDALDDILSEPYVDAVLVGPHDLSCSLGIPEQYEHPDFDAAIRQIIATARQHNVGVGVHIDSIDQEVAWAQAGANLIIHSSDISCFLKQLNADFSALRQQLAQQPTGTAEQVNI